MVKNTIKLACCQYINERSGYMLDTIVNVVELIFYGAVIIYLLRR